MYIEIGVKSDPVEYRYSYEWLFRLMAEEDVHHVQLGSFFELYQLPDAYFERLRTTASDFGIRISSLFTTHRELGGFLRGEPEWQDVAHRNHKRLVEVAALLGADRVGSNAGAVLRDRMADKEAGVACYLDHMKKMMAWAHGRGLECLTIEPMSCRAEPPTLPHEIHSMAEELMAHHAHTSGTVPVGYCADTAHGYADEAGRVHHTHMELLEAACPFLAELHVKNTDAIFNSTFGFSEENRANGIVDLPAVRDLLESNADRIPRDRLVAYLEMGGPKLGRDYSDCQLEGQLRESLRYVKGVFPAASLEA